MKRSERSRWERRTTSAVVSIRRPAAGEESTTESESACSPAAPVRAIRTPPALMSRVTVSQVSPAGSAPTVAGSDSGARE